jgi:zona occludens toxin (predicted ATPase)
MDWMHATIQRLAGRRVGIIGEIDRVIPGEKQLVSEADRPLTLGDLWGETAERNIDIVLTTTNLSQQLPHQFPFLERPFGRL